MEFKNVGIRSFAYFLPEQYISSQAIEEELSDLYAKLKMSPGRLELLTGIKERRYWAPGTLPSYISSQAAKKALVDFPRNQIDLLINASVCRDFLEPATAAMVHRELGLSSSCRFFDMTNACLGVLSAFEIAGNLIDSGKIKNALIVSGENSGPLLFQTLKMLKENPSITRKQVKKLFANFTIGSAAVAFLLSELSPGMPKILGGCALVDSAAVDLCTGNGNPNALIMETHSEELMEHGLNLAAANWDKAQEIIGSPDWIITHQVGLSHDLALREKLNIQNVKTYSTYPYWGNTGSCALPLTLIKLAQEGQIKSGEVLALLGIGSGLTSLMMGVKW